MSESDRIRWHCRRGMLELDLVLAAFLERHFDGLDVDERRIFTQLLDQPDNALLDLVMGSAEPADPGWMRVVDRLREGWACAATKM